MYKGIVGIDPSIGAWSQLRCAAVEASSRMRLQTIERRRWHLAVVAVAALTGSSIHPLVDDVSPIPTEAIVAAARCELRLGLVHQVAVWFADDIRR